MGQRSCTKEKFFVRSDFHSFYLHVIVKCRLEGYYLHVYVIICIFHNIHSFAGAYMIIRVLLDLIPCHLFSAREVILY